MQPLRLRVYRIVDFGSIVSLICGDPDTASGVTIHIESEPLKSNLLSKIRRHAGCGKPVQYAADRLLLHLDMLPADDGDGIRLIERSGTADPVQEIDR
jgi:hypothetical protein